MKDSRRRAINEFERLDQYLADLLARARAKRSPISGWEFRQGRHVAPGRYEYAGPWRPYSSEIAWGGEDVTAWFRATAAVPETMAGRAVVANLYPGGEGILKVNGRPVYGIDFNHREYRLTPDARPGERFHLEMECYYRDAPDDAIRNDVRATHRFELADLVAPDIELMGLYYDLSVALDMARANETTRPEVSARFLKIAQDAVARLDPYAGSADEYHAGAAAAREYLKRHLYDRGGAFYRPAGSLNLVGHCHLDLFYVWPYRESVRKNLRTNLIAADLMSRHGGYVFSQSQAKLFADMKAFYPDEYAAVKRLAAEGRFEPVGDMWVEPDGNIPCGEAYVRQILYGRKFFREEFGRSSTVAWLPDIFGVAASMPQILAQAGFRLFYTNKQSIWRDTNTFPHNTFLWEGIDGTRIMAHIPATHFIGKVDPETLALQWEEHREKIEAPEVLYTYGFGDGGGGPTERMLEYADRLARVDGLPSMRLSSVEEFARRLAASARDLPVWADELYLESHRGVATTKGDLKRKNRRAETALRNAEILSSVAAIRGGDRGDRGADTREELEALWKSLLECHFHDAVTGTHCTEAGREISEKYDRVLAEAGRIISVSAASLAPKADKKTLFNLTGAATSGHVIWDDSRDVTLASGGVALPTQRLGDGRLVTFVDGVPALGQKAFAVTARGADAQVPFTTNAGGMRSSRYSIRFGERGEVESLFDAAAQREIFAAPGNVFHLYEDKPGRFEAWDIARDYQARPIDQVRFCGIEDGQRGPLLASKVLSWKVGASDIRQEVILYAHSERVDFRTTIDWREERRILRVEFPLAIHARRAAYEIAFGVIERATRPTSPYDKAKFEVAFHRWFDVSEHGYGVSVLNDGKYGGSARDNVAALSLLKSPRFPDPTSDIGRHEFTYSLYPHLGTWREAGTFAEATLLNNPFMLADGATGQEEASYIALSRPGISVEALKSAEDGDGRILRLVDYYGQRGRVSVEFASPPGSVEACGIMEEASGDAGTAGVSALPGGFSYEARPFGINTFRLRW